jgi:hypothetical protein
VIWVTREQEYFCNWGWTGLSPNSLSGKSVFLSTAPTAVLKNMSAPSRLIRRSIITRPTPIDPFESASTAGRRAALNRRCKTDSAPWTEQDNARLKELVAQDHAIKIEAGIAWRDSVPGRTYFSSSSEHHWRRSVPFGCRDLTRAVRTTRRGYARCGCTPESRKTTSRSKLRGLKGRPWRSWELAGWTGPPYQPS